MPVDLHFGPTIRGAYVRRVVDMPLAELAQRGRAFLVLGHHDYYAGAARGLRTLRQWACVCFSTRTSPLPEAPRAWRLYTEAMDPEVLAWDDASNNRCLNAGKCIAIHNPISAYESAKKDKVLVPGTQREIAEVIDHIPRTWASPRTSCATTSSPTTSTSG